MKHYHLGAQSLAVALSALAGYTDALGFLALGGFFVSFMSGNSTRFAVGLAQGTSAAATGGAIIALFVLGVFLGSLVAEWAGERRRRRVILGAVALLLFLAAACHAGGIDRGALAAMVLAMGVENTMFERNGEVSIGLTYMTGTLVKLGQALAKAVRGREVYAWVPYLLLWLGLVAGAVAGALIYPFLGLTGLWLAAIAAAALALAAPSI
jgi:uncharacterized membrane protein YoaK (UPF0700 family)